MFITYLLRELRRRMRQAIFIAAGLALGVGLVITVTAASDGVSATQGTVLRSLYGVGTDVTVTQSPTAGSGGGTRFNFGGGPPGQQNAGTSFSRDILAGGGMGTIKSSSVTTVSGLKDVSGAASALVLNDVKLSGTVPAGGGQPGGQGGSGSGSINSSSFTVTGVDPAHDALGPLSSGTVTSGHNITTAGSDSNVAVVNSNYPKFIADILPLFHHYEVVLVCKRHATFRDLPFTVTRDFRVVRSDVELLERRPHFQRRDRQIEHVVAKFRYNARRGSWTLLWSDRNLRWHAYDGYRHLR